MWFWNFSNVLICMIVQKVYLRDNRKKQKEYEFTIRCDFCGTEFIKIGSNIQSKFCSKSCCSKFRNKFITNYENTSVSLTKFYNNNSVWNKGFTKHNNKSLLKLSNTLTDTNGNFQRVVKSEEHRKKLSDSKIGVKNSFYGKTHTKKFKEFQSKNMAEKISSGKLKIKGSEHFIKGWYTSDKNKESFYFDSFWELIRMKILDGDNTVVKWTKKHNITIPYFYKKLNRKYIPDFLITYKDKIVLEEVKGWEEPKKKMIKLKKLIEYCNNNNLKSNVLTFKEIELMCRLCFNKSVKILRKEFLLCE